MARFGVFIRIDVEAEDENKANEQVFDAMDTIEKPEGYVQWEHYETDEA